MGQVWPGASHLEPLQVPYLGPLELPSQHWPSHQPQSKKRLLVHFSQAVIVAHKVRG